MDREQLVQLNKDIALHAKRKELDEAMALFQQALDAKAENSHTYSNVINANIRCGSLDGAEKVMEIMKKRGRKRDVIICTTMIKGYCGAGLVQKALEMLNDMTERKPIVSPNLRTINTLLRGCVQTGDVSIAESLVARAQKDLKIQLDVSSWEYLTSLLSQCLKLEKALPVVGRLKDDPACASGLAGMHVNIARAAAVLGDWKVCKKSITSALAAIDKAADTTNTAVEDVEDTDGKVQLKTEKNTGGKRAWNSEEVDERRAESLELYREHLKAELKAELVIIEEFMERMKISKLSSFQYIFPYFLRIFPLASTVDTATPAATVSSSTGTSKKKESGNLKKELVKPIMYAVEQNFGLDIFARRLTQKSCDALNGYALVEAAPVTPAPVKKSKSKKEKEKEKRKKAQQELAAASGGDAAEDSEKPQEPVAAPVAPSTPAVEEKEKPVLTPLEAQIASFRALSAKAFDSSGKFVFKNVFSHTTAEAETAAAASKPAGAAEREVKVEVCSGAGEWVTAQAKNDPDADWVALELRHDRAYQTLTKAVFAGVPNLAVLCGDAMRILPSHMPTSSVTSLFVNHPEPPQQTGGRGGESQNRHLLEKAFFLEACRILKPNGMLTIVTDNLWYGRLLMRLVGNIPLNAYTDSAQQTPMCLHSASAPVTAVTGLESEWSVQETENGVALYEGKPGAAAGHVAEASSYFDRLWKRGNLVERYFLVLRKLPVSSVPAPGVLHAAAAAKKRPAGSIEVNVLPKGMENVKNSRIKFD